MEKTWILVAGSAAARLFEQEPKSAGLKLLKEFSHEDSRKKGAELASDRPGHNQTKGGGHGSFVEGSDPKEYEAERFSMELANELESGRVANQYHALVLVAAPRFHGLLNKHVTDGVRTLVRKHVDKDFTQVGERDLGERLREFVGI